MSSKAENSEYLANDHDHFYELWDSTFVLDKEDPDVPAIYDECHD